MRSGPILVLASAYNQTRQKCLTCNDKGIHLTIVMKEVVNRKKRKWQGNCYWNVNSNQLTLACSIAASAYILSINSR